MQLNSLLSPDPETVFVRKQCCNNPVNHRAFERELRPSLLAEGTSAWVSQIVVPPSSRGYGTEADLPCVTARGWPKSELRTSEAS
ncbi:unnamed protein product [Brassica rapa subsp. narinosa]